MNWRLKIKISHCYSTSSTIARTISYETWVNWNRSSLWIWWHHKMVNC